MNCESLFYLSGSNLSAAAVGLLPDLADADRSVARVNLNPVPESVGADFKLVDGLQNEENSAADAVQGEHVNLAPPSVHVRGIVAPSTRVLRSHTRS